MILRTSCDKCIFNKYGCELGKDIFYEAGYQRTEGLCGHKRTNVWIDSLKVDKNFNPDTDAFQYSNGEYITLSLLINLPNVSRYKGDKTDSVSKIVDKINNDNKFIKQVVFSTYQDRNKYKKNSLELAKYLKDNCRFPWTIDIHFEKYSGAYERVDRSSRFIKTNWFMTLGNINLLKSEAIKKIHEILSDRSKNPVCFYFNENDSFNIVAPKYAFEEMEGHRSIPWFEKIKTFNNWKDVCYQI